METTSYDFQQAAEDLSDWLHEIREAGASFMETTNEAQTATKSLLAAARRCASYCAAHVALEICLGAHRQR